MLRVGFVHEYHEGWLGGLNYFRNLLSAIERLPGRSIEAVVFAGSSLPEHHVNGLSNTEVVRSSLLNPGTPRSFARRLLKRVSARDLALEWLLRRHGIAVLSHSGYLGSGGRIPAIGWIPDFQFLHLQDFFQPDELKRRIAQSRDVCRFCECVLLSSHDAQGDLKNFSPACAEKSRVLQFVADVSFDERKPSGLELQQRYGFTGDYLLVTNQFWAHKNHNVIIEALRVLRARGRKVTVLATGHTHDHRQPQYFDSLMRAAKDSRVDDCFRVLGVLPREDLLGLMRDAVALLNPSLFEGWSTVVEEAKSLGKRIILSDIAVHREQAPRDGLYFPARDAEALAGAMEEAMAAVDRVQAARMMEEARELLPQRRRAFAQNYQEIVMEVASAGPAR